LKKDNKMSLSGLYVITDENLIPEHQLLQQIKTVVSHGAKIVQYRAKSTPNSAQLRQAKQLSEYCHDAGALFLINDNLDLAIASNADGVHLGQNDTAITVARQTLGPQAIIGITCHQSIELALLAEHNSANYVAFGRFYPSRTKPSATKAEISVLIEARKKLTVPIVAIGGITPDNGKPLISAGADMLAAIQSVFGSPTPDKVCETFQTLF
jgi:thiamine-phosphate pyrophosphorylase